MPTTRSIQTYCKTLAHTTEDVKWGNNLVFSIGNKMYAILDLDRPDTDSVSFKCSPENYDRLVQLPDIIPAPYAARFNWVKSEKLSALDEDVLLDLIKTAYEIVFAKLPKNLRNSLNKEN